MPQDNLQGTRLGKYRLISLLGRGGMGEVYLAEHEMLQSQVAVKVLPAHLARDEEMVGRFLREARAAARLRHPNIIRIHDVDQHDDINYFAMDYVEGRSLNELIASGGALDDAQNIRLTKQVLSALAEAHQAGIVHRDIKPDNVLIDTRGDAVVMDFGIAKAAKGTRFTALGSFVGTVNYASPEQARGQEVDARSDLYSWGVVMYEMATGRVPFGGLDTAAVFYQHVNEVPTPPRQLSTNLSPGLSAFILRLLEKEPADRFSSAHEALNSLERLSDPGRGRGRTRVAAGSRPGSRPPGGDSKIKALLKQADSQLGSGQWAAAQALAQKVLSYNPESKQAQELVAKAQEEQKRDKRAVELTTEAHAYLADELYGEAIQIITELAGVSRDKVSVLAWLEEVQAKAKQATELEAALQRGLVLEASGDLGQAESLYQTLQEEHGADGTLQDALARVGNQRKVGQMLQAAAEMSTAGDLAEAQEKLRQAQELAPSDAKVREALKDIRSRLSKGQRAEALVDEAGQHLELGRGAAALEALQEALQLTPGHAEALELRATAEEMLAQQPPEPLGLPSPSEPTRVQQPPPSEKPRAGVPSSGSQEPHAGTKVQPPEPPDKPPGEAKPPAEPEGKGKGAVWALVAVLVIAIGAGAWWFLSRQEPPKKAKTPPQAEPAKAATPSVETEKPEAKKEQNTAQPTGKPAAPPALAKADATQQQAAYLAAQGQKKLATGDLDGAARDFRAALKRDSKHAPAREGLAQVDKQIEAKKQRDEQTRRQAQAKIAAGDNLLAQDDLAGARQAYEQTLRLDPASTQAKRGLAQVQRRRRVLERMEAEARKKKEHEAELAEQLGLGRQFLAKDKLAEAEAAFKEARLIDHHSQQASQGLAEVKRRKQELAKATAEKERQKQQKAEARQLVAEGRGFLLRGKLAEAEKAFNQALQKAAGLPEAKQGLAEVDERRQAHDRAAAEARRKEQKQKQVQQNLHQGSKLLSQGKPKQARQAFAKALKLAPGNGDAAAGIKQAEAQLRAQAAKQAQDRSEDSKRRQAQAALAQGVSYFNAKRYDQAVASFERYLKAYPDDAAARNNLALARQMQQEMRYGSLIIGCRPMAKAYVDGKQVGVTPLVVKKVAVGMRKVQVVAYGGMQTRMVQVKGRSTIKLRFELRGAKLLINSKPWAEIYFDGQKVGNTPVELNNLPLGVHRVTLRRAGYRQEERQVTLRFGKKAVLSLILRR